MDQHVSNGENESNGTLNSCNVSSGENESNQISIDFNEEICNETCNKTSEVEKPYEGMEFNSENDVYDFYNMYAKSKGFSIRKNFVRKSRKTNCIVARTISCSKEGFKREKTNYNGVQVKHGRETREGCKAHIYICQNECGTWFIKRFQEEHNHQLASPLMVKHLRSHRKVCADTRILINTMCTCGSGPSKIAAVCKATAEECVTTQVCKDILKNTRKNATGHECLTVVQTFLDKMSTDLTFFFKIQVDEKGTVRSIFWADGISRASYRKFGDVIVFDTIFRTNRFPMQFASFTGINHHRQSTLFGCALLADETIETFTWLFQTWLSCMYGKAPDAIITDQDLAMREAIALIFPMATHRLCSWHIRKNALTHLQKLQCNKEFEVEYNNWIYNSETIEEFESKWICFREKYSLTSDSWLSKMYDVREHWVPAFLSNTFLAGISTSQRAESMNSFFDGYITCQTSLSEFVQQYDRALTAWRDAEEAEDFKALSSKHVLLSHHPIEAQASLFYTPVNFNLFQKEFKMIVDCDSKKISKDSETTTYEVYMHGKRVRTYTVFFIAREQHASCSCQKFECEGILCCHILYIFRKKGIVALPKLYLLDRWGIEARFLGGGCPASLQTTDKPSTNMLWDFSSILSDMYEWGRVNKHNLTVAMQMMHENMIKIKEISKTQNSCCTSNIHCSLHSLETRADTVPILDSQSSFIDIHDRSCVRSKGRPRKLERFKSAIESLKTETKRRKCHFCDEEGHYQSTCKLKGKTIEK